jgi:hypothetical protein
MIGLIVIEFEQLLNKMTGDFVRLEGTCQYF